jgi:hypothetical protein
MKLISDMGALTPATLAVRRDQPFDCDGQIGITRRRCCPFWLVLCVHARRGRVWNVLPSSSRISAVRWCQLELHRAETIAGRRESGRGDEQSRGERQGGTDE